VVARNGLDVLISHQDQAGKGPQFVLGNSGAEILITKEREADNVLSMVQAKAKNMPAGMRNRWSQPAENSSDGDKGDKDDDGKGNWRGIAGNHTSQPEKPLIDLGMIRDIAVRGTEVNLTLALKSDHGPLKEKFVRDIEQTAGALPDVSAVKVNVAILSEEELQRLFPRVPLKGIEKGPPYRGRGERQGRGGQDHGRRQPGPGFCAQRPAHGTARRRRLWPQCPPDAGPARFPRGRSGNDPAQGKFGLRVVSLA